METTDPEYVALRKGETIEWEDLKALLVSPA
jgi:hypothetical protein